MAVIILVNTSMPEESGCDIKDTISNVYWFDIFTGISVFGHALRWRPQDPSDD